MFSWLRFQSNPWIEKLECFSYKWMVRLTATERQADQRIVLVDIDDTSIERIGSWPWPRSRLAEMIDFLTERGVRVIGLNLPLFEKENTESLDAMRSFLAKFEAYALSKKNLGVADWVKENFKEMEQQIDKRGVLIEKVRKASNVILPAYTGVPPGHKESSVVSDTIAAENAVTENGFSSNLIREIEVKELHIPFPELAHIALGFGHGIDSPPGFGTGTTSAAIVSYRGFYLPSFALRIAAVYNDLAAVNIIAEENRIRMKDIEIPLWKGHQIVKFYRGGERFPTYPFADLLQGNNSPSFQGKIVLIGLNLKGMPRITTPLWESVCRNRFYACVLDNLLNRSFVSRPHFMNGAESLAILVFGSLFALFFSGMGEKSRLGSAAGFAVLILGAQALVLFRFDIWVKGISLAAAILAIYSLTTLRKWFVFLLAGGESAGTNRLLGLSFQDRGLPDLAFETFRKLPFDGDTKDLIYNLGLEYEQKRLFGEAIAAYEYVMREKPFRDASLRVSKLRKAIESSGLGNHVNPVVGGITNVTSLEEVKKIGRYDILEVIGKGSMGLVYKALDPKINRLLAIKTIRFSDEFDDDVIRDIKERFFREAEIAGRLSHPSIVTIHDLGEDQDLTYMAMEYLEGEDLEKFISRKNLLPLEKVIHIAAGVAEALDFAHRADVIHRDIKPANIRLLKNGGVKVTDFGIARAISSSRTKTGVILGTPNYMSPEQIMGQKIDPRSDIFSLGVLFYQLLAGELPFQGDNLSGLLYQITQIKQPALKTFNPKLPQACEQIVDRALAKNPDERFKTAGQMARILKLLASKIEQVHRKKVDKGTYIGA
ncbi:MAG: protein kinase [Deltaproteobacteria bacterium]|nr:protein kinase [Deltaproteobacteria bacterium]